MIGLAASRPVELVLLQAFLATVLSLAALPGSGGDVSWASAGAVLLATLTAAAVTLAVSRKIELHRTRRQRLRILDEADRVLAEALARERGEGAPRDEASIDAELARLRHRDLLRYAAALRA